MVRISIPTLPPPPLIPLINPLSSLTLKEAAAHTASFLQKGKGKTLIITGAGISVDSGIRAYRGDDGSVYLPLPLRSFGVGLQGGGDDSLSVREGARRSSPSLFLFPSLSFRRYTNPNYRPVYYSELVDPTEKGEDFRKRYWSRGQSSLKAGDAVTLSSTLG